MANVYYSGATISYDQALLGLSCLMVASVVKNETFYSSTVPITTNANQNVNFTLSKSTTGEIVALITTMNQQTGRGDEKSWVYDKLH